jgi:5,10-methylenetetrahydromethanopterin reductase
VSDKMLDDLCIAGTPDVAVKKLNAFRDIGIDLPIIQFNPINNVKESFGLLTKTFSGESNE